jgi:hypothetical protein
MSILKRFDPERWGPGGPNAAPQRPFEFMSFHGGPRECPGRDMAFLEAKIAVCTILRRKVAGQGLVRLRLAPGATVEVKRAIILTARKGIKMQIQFARDERQPQTEESGESETEAPEESQQQSSQRESTSPTPLPADRSSSSSPPPPRSTTEATQDASASERWSEETINRGTD